MAIDVGGLLSGGVDLATAYIPYEASGQQMEDLRNIAQTYRTGAADIGQQAAQAVQFQPFSVKSTGGTAAVGATGGLTLSPNEQMQALQQNMYNQALAGSAAAPVTADSLFSQLQQANQVQTDRQRLELENRLAAQGRLDTGSAMYGGTSTERLAMEQAIAEQTAKNMLTAQQYAPQLQGQNLTNIGSALTNMYQPESQMLSALTPSVNLANTAQSGRVGAAEALANAGTSGLMAEAEAYGNIANLEANRSTALANTLQGMFGTQASGQAAATTDYIGDLLSSLMGGSTSSGSSGDLSVEALRALGFDDNSINAFLS